MADVELIRWNGGGHQIVFFLTRDEIRGYKDLSISSKLDTEDTTEDSQTFTKKKNIGNYEIKLTAVLNANLGVRVHEQAMLFTEAARHGSSGYLYIASAGKLTKFLPMQFLATDAEIKEIRTTRNGTWTSCEVDFTLKQCTKYVGSQGNTAATGGSSGGGGGGGGGGGSAGGTGATSRNYVVRIPGTVGGETVRATSVQGAITQSLGKNWTGTVRVDGKDYDVKNGQIVKSPDTRSTGGSSSTAGGGGSSKSSSTTSKTANSAKQAATDVGNMLQTAAQNLIKNVSAAKAASNAVTKEANTKKTTTKTNSVITPITNFFKKLFN